MSEIKKSNHKVGNVDRSAAMAELQDIRDSIDNIDASIVHMLAERFRFTQKVGVLKARHNMPPSDPGREAQQITRLREIASAAKVTFLCYGATFRRPNDFAAEHWIANMQGDVRRQLKKRGLHLCAWDIGPICGLCWM